MHPFADGGAVFRQLRQPIQPVDAPAQQVEPELIAERPAERARAPDARPAQLADHGVRTHLAVVDLAFEEGEQHDGEVGQHQARAFDSTLRTVAATRSICSSVSPA